MSVFGISCRSCGWLAALAVGAFGLDIAHAGGQGEKIQFSEPSTPSPVVASNLTTTLSPGLNRLNPEPSRFQQAQEDLFRPLKEAIDADDPMHAVLSVPLPQQQQQYQQQRLSRHAQKLLDQERNWAFTDFDELYPEPTLEEALGVTDSDPAAREKDFTSVIQKYYDGHDQKPNAKLDQKKLQAYDPRKDSFTGAAFRASLAAGLPGGDETIFTKNIFAGTKDSDDSEKAAAGFGDPAKFDPSSDEVLAAQKHRAEFNHLLDPSGPASPTPNNLFADPAKINQSALFGQTSATLPQPSQASDQPHRSVLYPLGITDPTAAALHSSVFDDPTAAALGLPNPALTKPQAPTVTVDSIQNMVDPYAASLAKRKF